MRSSTAPTPAHPLSAATLGDLDPRVLIPRYDRGRLERSIVHIGVGGFHRAHQAVYLDDLCREGVTDWAITGAGVLPGDMAMSDALVPQDYLYSLITRDSRATEVRVVGSIVDYVVATPDIEPLREKLADPQTRIVSLTVTEGGYPVTDAGDFAHPPGAALPAVFAAIAEGLRRRRDAGRAGFTVMSCDNIVNNGAVARAATLGVAAEMEPGLESWIERNVAFPSSMVDRITPATTSDDKDYLAEEYGLLDRWPVVSEPFSQWVVQDTFSVGRPAWEDAGAIMTDDVEPYEVLKLRVLNAGHSCVAYLAALAGHVYVHEVVADPPFARFLRGFFDGEAIPSLPPVPGVDVAAYTTEVLDRFANPRVGDKVERLCLDGSAKFPKFLVPTIEAQLASGGSVRLGALALAGWCQYLLGEGEGGRELSIAPDPDLQKAQAFARESAADPRAFLRYHDVLGTRLPSDPRFASAFVDSLTWLRTQGVGSALSRLFDKVE